MTRTAARTLTVMLQHPQRWVYGYDLMRQADIASGTLYPLLSRLADEGWLETRWEESPLPGRPARHKYRLTSDGRAAARAALENVRPAWVANLQLEVR